MYSDLRKHAQATIVQLFPQAPFSPQVPAEETDPAFPQEQPRVHHRTCGLCCPVDTLVDVEFGHCKKQFTMSSTLN